MFAFVFSWVTISTAVERPHSGPFPTSNTGKIPNPPLTHNLEQLLALQTCSSYDWLVGCKHRASEGMFYIGGRSFVLCRFIEQVTFACCAFIFALRNIALGGYLHRKHLEPLRHDVRPETYIYIYRKSVPLNTTESSLCSQ